MEQLSVNATREARPVDIILKSERPNVYSVQPPIPPQASCGLLTSGRGVRARGKQLARIVRAYDWQASHFYCDHQVAGFTQRVDFQSDGPTMLSDITNSGCSGNLGLSMSWLMITCAVYETSATREKSYPDMPLSQGALLTALSWKALTHFMQRWAICSTACSRSI